MSWPKALADKKGRLLVISVFLLFSTLPGEYYVRWLSVLALALFLGILLIGVDVKLSGRSVFEEKAARKRPDFERALRIVRRAKRGGARSLVEEELLEVCHTLTGKNFHELRANPPPALQAFYSSRNPYEGLKRALEILEADLNED
ncbi:hypothetical protein [Thermococcus sp.]|uniref:hypothetical protein n=1 Tax=Thermococcus sp. TaxID=35749 RepID=UPI0026231639|nr:hypothetical protein [Thermococcus sp.]